MNQSTINARFAHALNSRACWYGVFAAMLYQKCDPAYALVHDHVCRLTNTLYYHIGFNLARQNVNKEQA